MGLVITEPADGWSTTVGAVTVRGLAAPGSTITREIPFWFDEHAVADLTGRWSFDVQLNPGENVFTFRVGDESATAQTLTVHHI